MIVRPRKEGYYEIISGHRRKYAAERLGYKKIPVIIRMMQDDEAVVTMVDSNLQREQITPSEKAYAYKMKYDAIKKKAGRKNCGQVDHNTGKRSIDVIGELCGDSAKQVQRYIKMTELIPALLDKVDDGSMGFTPAVQLSYLKKKEQQEIIDAMEATQCTPSLSQAIRIKKLSEAGKLTESEAEGILGNILYGDLHVFAKLCQHGGDPFSMWRQGDDGASLVLLVFKAFHQPSCRHFSNDIAHGWMTVPYFLRYARYCFLFPVGQNEKQGKPLWPYVNAV